LAIFYLWHPLLFTLFDQQKLLRFEAAEFSPVVAHRRGRRGPKSRDVAGDREFS
jgi:hypothetical protein